MALVLKRKLSPYYVTNLASEDFPFTGIIEMTNLISGDETNGRHLVYLPKYTSPGDPLFEGSDDEIWKEFRKHLLRVVPDFQDTDVEKRFTFREAFRPASTHVALFGKSYRRWRLAWRDSSSRTRRRSSTRP